MRALCHPEIVRQGGGSPLHPFEKSRPPDFIGQNAPQTPKIARKKVQNSSSCESRVSLLEEDDIKSVYPCGCFAGQRIKRTERGHSCPRTGSRPTDVCAEAGGEGAWLRRTADVSARVEGGGSKSKSVSVSKSKIYTTTRYLESTATLNQKRETRNRKQETVRRIFHQVRLDPWLGEAMLLRLRLRRTRPWPLVFSVVDEIRVGFLTQGQHLPRLGVTRLSFFPVHEGLAKDLAPCSRRIISGPQTKTR